jgi:hypothetical protein
MGTVARRTGFGALHCWQLWRAATGFGNQLSFDSEPNPIQHNLGHTWDLVSFTLSLAQVK